VTSKLTPFKACIFPYDFAIFFSDNVEDMLSNLS
jgi:hypothetical protein